MQFSKQADLIRLIFFNPTPAATFLFEFRRGNSLLGQFLLTETKSTKFFFFWYEIFKLNAITIWNSTCTIAKNKHKVLPMPYDMNLRVELVNSLLLTTVRNSNVREVPGCITFYLCGASKTELQFFSFQINQVAEKKWFLSPSIKESMFSKKRTDLRMLRNSYRAFSKEIKLKPSAGINFVMYFNWM